MNQLAVRRLNGRVFPAEDGICSFAAAAEKQPRQQKEQNANQPGGDLRILLGGFSAREKRGAIHYRQNAGKKSKSATAGVAAVAASDYFFLQPPQMVVLMANWRASVSPGA